MSRKTNSGYLAFDGVSVSFGDRRVLTDVSLVVPAGQRVGLIGENGSGKSTLLRVAGGMVQPTAGTVTALMPGRGHPTIGLLHQEAPFAREKTVAEAIESAVAPARDAVERIDRRAREVAEDPDDRMSADAYADALTDAERLGAWDVDTRIAVTLAGLGLRDVPPQRRTGELSGGQLARLSLAWLLLSGPDVLLLDEPTNHLDDAATAHLRDVLRGWRGPVLIASHDRAFLDEAVTSLVDLDPAPHPERVSALLVGDGPGSGIETTRFTGGYTSYLHARAETRARWERQYRDEQHELVRLRAAVSGSQTVGHDDWRPRTEGRAAQRFYADRNATVVSRRVNDARDRLESLEAQQVRRPPVELRFTTVPRRSIPVSEGPVVTASGLTVTGRLMPTSLSVGGRDKVLVTGPNGAGKSTLLHLIAGRLRPTGGRLLVDPDARVGLLTQHVEIPDPHERGPDRTVRQAYRDALGPERDDITPLSSFGLIAARDEDRPVVALSVGQQRRLALAVLLADPPDVLLLDEPTNHFSLSLVTDLESAIGDYPGAVVVAAHDRWIRSRWTGRRLHLDGRTST